MVTKSALTQARKHLSHTAFTALNQQVVDAYYAHHPDLKTWRGHRLCAIDGSQIRTPNETDIIRHFGLHVGKQNRKDSPQALVSVYYDVLNHISIDSSINPTKTSERDCAGSHLQYALPNDLSILDRGYNAFWLYAFYEAHEQRFCMRAKINQCQVFKAFAESGKKEEIITLKPCKYSVTQCRRKGLSTKPLALRLVRVELDEDVEVLITNLFDSHAYPAQEFKDLYHLRWGVEENYKRLKQWVEIENFSGKTSLSVKQDFYARILSTNLTAILVNSAQKRVDKTHANRKLGYQINFAQALSKMKNTMLQWINLSPLQLRKKVEQFIAYIASTIEPVRKGRRYHRPKYKPHNFFYSAYKRAS